MFLAIESWLVEVDWAAFMVVGVGKDRRGCMMIRKENC
jgi:hypothetical protein